MQQHVGHQQELSEQQLIAGRPSTLATGSVAMAALAFVAAMFGLPGASAPVAGLVLWAMTPFAGIGLMLAGLALLRGEIDRTAAHAGLWLNGIIVILATPAGMVLLLWK